MHNPFFYKKKLFYQTKINLWGHDESFLGNKFTKKKWGFLNKKLKKKIFSVDSFSAENYFENFLDTFSYYPFSPGVFSKRVKSNFKNNLYLRKLIRLKYGRLKNKEFYTIFKNSNGYKAFLKNFGSRFDVNLFNLFNILLFPISVFHIRQNILHGKILLNGSRVKSPNIRLRAFDVISLKFLDFSFLNCLYKDISDDYKSDDYFAFLAYNLFVLSKFDCLSEDVQKKFITDLSVKLGGDLLVEFFNDYFVEIFQFYSSRKKKIVENKNNKIVDSINFLDLDKIISILNQKYIKTGHLKLLKEFKKGLNFDYILNKENLIELNILNFFNNKFNYNHFEFKFNGQFLDLIFLGYSGKENIKNTDKFLLHYLY